MRLIIPLKPLLLKYATGSSVLTVPLTVFFIFFSLWCNGVISQKAKKVPIDFPTAGCSDFEATSVKLFCLVSRICFQGLMTGRQKKNLLCANI